MVDTVQMCVDRSDQSQYRIRLTDGAGKTDEELRALLMQAFERVNPAAHLMNQPLPVLESAYFKELYAHGPVLFVVATTTADTGKGGERVAGLKVSPARLDETVTCLRSLNVSVRANC